ncbi:MULTISPECIES: glycoside hydrolase family 2 TIM barrel-domain containing protein [unclassified Leeuwenhoekiella]|uniref:glycoside hydrolase family 2 TIM barrel-domain containing protein n=1 Tax=unclassified Leeuwenhoekiella TaxID=2615029 RepID=UPI000C659516|nr:MULTISPECIES: glycoside hydrolase family 2 TIM barrel-domain containing protein [unclassified Leeuwenhoekiella]MAW95691.1 beta-galactosidase [Leeuwenhoekiella sp.]MBA80759.1 beta-galactosidase [Leeuwenhoekiella sp.]|tara:strand:+ start:12014 stop:14434 length:2421 start_codon:yes stop_codon:yes gene_type:complete
MKLKLTCLFSLIAISCTAQTRSVTELHKNWKFQKGEVATAETSDFDDSKWESVTVPHDWAIYGPFDKEIDKQTVAITQNGEKVATEKTGRTGALPFTGTGWYRNTFEIPEFEKGKKAILLFEGAMSEPQVYLNGKKIGKWAYGYSYFYFDITKDLKEGENTLAVQLSNKEFSSRWYPGAGLYRPVSLIIKNTESIDQWGTTITSPVATQEVAQVNVKTRFSGEKLRLVTRLYDAQGNEIAQQESTEAIQHQFEQNIKVENPQLWSPENPYLYTAVSQLYDGYLLKDEVTTKFGIRSISYSAENGFQLNGKTRKFKGVCLHHDLGPLGTAVNKAALRRQMQILKDLGCDAIRSAHNMPSFEQLELADEMGFMFLAESFDEWKKPKVKNGYNRFFDEYAKRDVENLVRATRNHPSIVMWSAGNEVPDQYGSEGVKRARWLQNIFHKEDPTRPVTVGMDQVKATMESGFGAILDVPGLNYRVHLYEEAYEKFPQGFILGSETASTVSSRGIYKFPVEKASMKEYPDFQSSSYDLEYCSWSNLPEDDFILQDNKSWVIGEFVWTGFDYLGEPTPYDTSWPSRSSYFGMVDLAGIPKDRFYLYRSRWNTKDETLHILPHWNWEGREGEKTPVFVYSSYDRAELFVNGKSQGIQIKNDSTPQTRYRLMWHDVIYEPGTLRVVALDDNNNPAAEQEIKTAGKPYAIKLEADRTNLKADGKDLSFVTVSVVDKDGIPCPTAKDQLNFEVTGAGSYRAACNGDATSLEIFHEPTMKLFSGKLVVLVQSSEEQGSIQLTVSGKGLKSQFLKLNTSL